MKGLRCSPTYMDVKNIHRKQSIRLKVTMTFSMHFKPMQFYSEISQALHKITYVRKQ